MKAFILAAGLGTRLRPLTEKQPKVMVEVGGQKILERTIDQLRAAGVDEFIINTHYFPEIVPNYFGDGHKWGVKIEYSHERDILGTAGGLKKVEERFRSEKEFLVVYGDNVFDLDFSPFIQKPLAGSCMLMLYDRSKSPNSEAVAGLVELDENGLVKSFYEGVEKTELIYGNGGVYKCSPQIFEFIPPAQFFDFGRQVFPEMLKSDVKIETYIISPNEALFGIDNLDCLEKANQYFNSRMHGLRG
jgi:mannose-1-phosphate guanylyltransferase/mannose-1-phosphate guanylyltransferase/phosphomannomutase